MIRILLTLLTITLFLLDPLYVKCQGLLTGKERKELMPIGIATSQQTWWYFNTRLNKPLAGQRFFRVYILQLDVWLKDIHQLNNRKFSGKIDKELSSPVQIDSMEFEPNDIADWVIVDDNTLVGGFWLRLQENNVLMKFTTKADCEIIFKHAISEDFEKTSEWISNNNISYSDNSLNIYDDLNKRYPGGMQAISDFIMDNIYYPTYALTFNIKGLCYLEIKINSDGTISGGKILQSIGGGTDEIVRYVLKNMPIIKESESGVNIVYKMGIYFTR